MTPYLCGLFGIRTGSSTILGAIQQIWDVTDGLARRLLVGALVLMLGSSIVAALSPLLLKVLVDELDVTAAHTIDVGLAYLILLYALTHWLSRSLGEMRGMLLNRADQRVQTQLSNQFFRHVMSLPLRFHLDRQTGALSRTLTNGVLGYRVLLHHLVNSILPVVIELATMGTILAFLGHTVFLLIIGMSVLSYGVAFWIGAMRIHEPARDASTANIDAGAIFTDSILNYETVKYFNGESQVSGRFVGALRNTERRWADLYRRKMENGLAIATIFTLSLGLSVYASASAVQQGSMSIGEFILVNAYIIQLTRPLELIGFAFRDTMQGVAFIERMAELLEEKREMDCLDYATDSSSVSDERGDLVFENVSFSYNADNRILKDINFTVPSGNTLGIVGASGSGKSSLVRLLLRLLDPTKGRICLHGVPLSTIPIPVLRNSISVVPQDIALFNDSIAYNIAFGKQGSTDEEVVKAAKVAGIHDFILGLPEGYNTKVGERGLKLSGGEKQRVAIARAAIKRPKIFVFDEATSSLDSETERAILRNFHNVAKTTTTVIIAHRLSTLVRADEIVVLKEGSVVERGTHDTLLQQGGMYAATWRGQYEDMSRLHDADVHALRR